MKYDGCELRVLDRCSDPVVDGRFGAYGTPQFTSGTTQGFDVSNEGELYAKLPLGAASLSGRVQAGETLHLRYFVSGVAQNTRDAIFAGDLRANDGCAGATHFVWAYNLGAFELSTTQRSSVEANATAAGIGEAGGKRAHQEQSVGAGGKLTSCETQDQRACRVPIRLVVRPITSGENPLAVGSAAPSSSASGDAPTNAAGQSAEQQARALVANASDRLDQGDAAGCLEMATKAAGFDVRFTNDHAFKVLRARCVMASGKCDDGKKDYRAALASADRKRELQDWQLDNEARDESNRYCPSAGTTNHVDYIVRAFREMKAAAKVRDGKRCAALADGLADHKKLLDERAPGGEGLRASSVSNLASNGFLIAARCVAVSTGKCSDGAAQMKKECRAIGTSGCEKMMEQAWESVRAAGKIECK